MQARPVMLAPRAIAAQLSPAGQPSSPVHEALHTLPLVPPRFTQILPSAPQSESLEQRPQNFDASA